MDGIGVARCSPQLIGSRRVIGVSLALTSLVLLRRTYSQIYTAADNSRPVPPSIDEIPRYRPHCALT